MYSLMQKKSLDDTKSPCDPARRDAIFKNY